MRNAGNKRLTLLLVALVMLACGVMALGGTFATQVKKENGLDEQYLNNATLDYGIDITYSTPGDSSVQPFLSSAPFSNTFWCPGYTKVVYLTVKNKEDFPVECIMTIGIDNPKLGQVMSYAVIDSPDNLPDNWKEFLTKATASGHLADENPTVFNIPNTAPLSSGATKSYALAIHMDENATNEYQKESMKLSFNLLINADYEPGATPATK